MFLLDRSSLWSRLGYYDTTVGGGGGGGGGGYPNAGWPARRLDESMPHEFSYNLVTRELLRESDPGVQYTCKCCDSVGLATHAVYNYRSSLLLLLLLLLLGLLLLYHYHY